MTKIPELLNAVRTSPSSKPGPLAPDGLPWPEGYFDRIPPKQTLEEATAMFGVRPSLYSHGRPCYTLQEMQSSAYKGKLPDETEEVQELYRKWADAPDFKP